VTATIEDDAESADSDGEQPIPFLISSYAHLLHLPAIPGGTRNAGNRTGGRSTASRNRTGRATSIIDAIIVPTVRSAEHLRYAARLAADARCQLVVLYTDSFPPGLSPVLAELQEGTAAVLALGSAVTHRLLDLAAGMPQSLVSSCALDISRKRNLGLLIGRVCGWERMLFLDDDIRRLSIVKLRSAADLLRKYPVVGLQVIKYPDASAVGHARRLTGHRQEPFISGGSLLINPQRLDGFFPPVYHEDWLCTINHLRRGEVAVGGTVGQLAYKPFTTSERARLEEFGDILTSGLLWLIHTRHGRSDAESVLPTAEYDYWREATKPRFWEEILDQRATLLTNIAGRLKLMSALGPGPQQSVKAAQQRCAQLTPAEFVSFTEKWLNSLAVWRSLLSQFSHADSVGKALAELGLSHAVRMYEADPADASARLGPETGEADEARPRSVQVRGPRSALILDVLGEVLGETARSVLSSQGRKLRDRFNQPRRSAGHSRSSRLGGIENGGGAGGRAQRPVTGRDQAKHKDHAAAGGQQQPGGMTPLHELGPQWTAVQVSSQDRAGDGHAERLADLTAG
jgi:hypothetical protein